MRITRKQLRQIIKEALNESPISLAPGIYFAGIDIIGNLKHGFVYYVDRDGEIWAAHGGPETGNPMVHGQKLVKWWERHSTSDLAKASYGPVTLFKPPRDGSDDTGLATKISDLEAAFERVPTGLTYDGRQGPNSNSVAAFLWRSVTDNPVNVSSSMFPGINVEI
tara:strand:- start:356 stop:850 length:495 start_codon:yes stop_codon:yes gene_type:complete